MRKVSRCVFVSLFMVMVPYWGSALLDAQVSPAGTAVAIRGKVAAFNGQELLVATSGGEVSVKVLTGITITGEVAATLSEITPGVFVGASAQKQADGIFRASQINIFREEERGFLEGHRPQTSLPGHTMTNATVEVIENLTVQDVTQVQRRRGEGVRAAEFADYEARDREPRHAQTGRCAENYRHPSRGRGRFRRGDYCQRNRNAAAYVGRVSCRQEAIRRALTR
ncbi:MAG: hypothetical protein HW373_1346 [Deltaproteobacteria bacterium]|nr:hypothetical protein [Deltaproteobacteria bacterium]